MIIKKNWLVTLLLGVLLLGFLIKPNNKTTLENSDLLTVKPKKQFAIWVEQTRGKKDWVEATEFPGKGYKLGSDTQCVDNTGAVVDNSTVMNSDGSVTVTSSSTTYCTLYFELSSSLFADTIKDKYESDTTQLGIVKDDGSGNDGYLIYHDGLGDYENSEYEAGDYSYRFSGNNPDNYVCMDGKSEEGPCDSKQLYRVIGIFPTDASHTKYQVKLIKSEYLTYEETETNLKISTTASRETPSGWTPRVDNQASVNGFYWSGSSSINWNNWKISELNKALNKTDGIYLQSLQKYIDSELISDTTWYIGGNDSDKIIQQDNMKLAYENELGAGRLTAGTKKCASDSSSYVDCTDELLYQTSKVGLMYATEYGYASEPTSWTSQLYDYNDRNNSNKNKENNWLYNGVYEWLLTRYADLAPYVLRVYFAGYVNGYSITSYYAGGVRPVLVLSSSAEIEIGEGTKLSPWRIKLPEQS